MLKKYPRNVRRAWIISFVATFFAGIVMMPPAQGANAPVDFSWSYSATQKKIVSTDGGSPYTLKGGTAVTMSDGSPGVRFTTAPSLATYSTTSFPTPGTRDFEMTVTFSLDKVYPKSSANIAQHGLWDGHQIKMQLTSAGTPQCVFNGTGGRLLLPSANRSSLVGSQVHTFSCWRSGNDLGVTVDGVSNSQYFEVGSITPTGKATIGSKSASAGPTDQFFGTFKGLKMKIGATTGGS